MEGQNWRIYGSDSSDISYDKYGVITKSQLIVIHNIDYSLLPDIAFVE
jgi:hypothetical protein